MISTNPSPAQRCEDIRALLSFERPEDPETNEQEWQSFLLKRHDSFTKFPYDSDDDDDDDDDNDDDAENIAKTQEQDFHSSSVVETKSKPNSFLQLTAALPSLPEPRSTELRSCKDNDPDTIKSRLQICLMRSSHPTSLLQSCFDSELALLASRYSKFPHTNLALEQDEEQQLSHADIHALIGDTLSLCAFFLAFPRLECYGMEFAEVLKNAFWLAHTSSSSTPSAPSPILQLHSLRLLSLTLHLFHPPSLAGFPQTPATPRPNSIFRSYYHIDLYGKAGIVFEKAGMHRAAEGYFKVSRWGWLCVGGDEGGI